MSALLFGLMAKVVIAVTKEAVRSNVPEPGSTVLTTLIDFVTAQQNATQSALQRIEKKIDDIQQNALRTGRRMLIEARQITAIPLRKDRIKAALTAFTQASEYSQMSDPLVPLYARFSAGACYDLLKEKGAALYNYEEVFREAMQLQKLAKQGMARQTHSTAVRVSLRLLDWIEQKPDAREQQEFIKSLVRSKPALDDFIEKLLTLITKRKGVSREVYLEPWRPKRLPLPRLPASWLSKPGSTARRRVKARRSSTGSQRLIRHRPLLCATCKTYKSLDTCPACKGTKKYGNLSCPRCFGRGSTYVCECDKPASTRLFPVGDTKRRRCVLCAGRGQISLDLSVSWLTCPACAGTGFIKG